MTRIEKMIVLFFNPKYFWMIYVCYFFLCLHGFLNWWAYDAEYCDIMHPYPFIFGLTPTSTLAMMAWLYALYKAIQYAKAKNKTVFSLYLVHAVLIGCSAPYIIIFGWMILIMTS